MKPISKIEFCNYKGISYLEVVALTPSGIASVRREIEDFMLNDGVLQNVEDIAKSIKAELNIEKTPAFELVLHTAGQFKTIVSLPTMSQSQASSLYYKEMREHGKFEKFVSAYNVYKHSLGYIFSTYYMSEGVVKSMKILAKLLGSRVTTVTPYGFYLHKSLNTKGSFVYFHTRGGVCTMLLICEGELISTYDFVYEDARDIERQFLLVMSKHEFEFEHREITHYAVDSDEELTLDLGLELISLDDISEPEPEETETLPSEKMVGAFASVIASIKALLTKLKKKPDAQQIEEPQEVQTAAQESTPTYENVTFAEQLSAELTDELATAAAEAVPEAQESATAVALMEREAEDDESEPLAIAETVTTVPAEDTAQPKAAVNTKCKPCLIRMAIDAICAFFARFKKQDHSPMAQPTPSIIRTAADVELPTLDSSTDNAITVGEIETRRAALISATQEVVVDDYDAGYDNFRERFKNTPEWVRIEFAQRAREILKGEGMSYIVEEQATVFLYHGKYHSHLDIRNDEVLYFTEE